MKIIELYNLRKEIYETIHIFLLEHNWCTEVSRIDRMGYKKRKNLRLTSDFIRLFLGTIVVIKTKGTKKDFKTKRNGLWEGRLIKKIMEAQEKGESIWITVE